MENKYLEKLETAIDEILYYSPTTNYEKLVELKNVNKPIVESVLECFDNENSLINEEKIVNFINTQTTALINSKDTETPKNVFYFPTKIFNEVTDNPIIQRTLLKTLYQFSKMMQFIQFLPQDHALPSTDNNTFNKIFKVPYSFFNPPSHNKEIYIGTTDPIPTASSSIRFQDFETKLRAFSGELNTSGKKDLTNNGFIKIKDLALLIISVAFTFIESIDRHILDHLLLATYERKSQSLEDTFGHNALDLENNIFFTKEFSDVAGKAFYLTKNNKVSHNVTTFNTTPEDKEVPLVKHYNDLMDLILREAATVSGKPIYRNIGLVLTNNNIATNIIKKSTQFKQEMVFDEKLAKTYTGYIGTFNGIDIVASDLIKDNILLLCERYLVAYGVASFNIETVNRVRVCQLTNDGIFQNTTENAESIIVLKTRDFVGIPETQIENLKDKIPTTIIAITGEIVF